MKWEGQSEGSEPLRELNTPDQSKEGLQECICPLVASLWTLEGAVGQRLGGKLSCDMVLYAWVLLSLMWSSSGLP